MADIGLAQGLQGALGALKPLRTKAAAQLLGVSERTLARWRLDGAGPPFFRMGGGVFYSRPAIEEYLRRASAAGD